MHPLVRALRDGDKTFALLTGIGGAGKSTLATRAANRLKEDGFRVVAVRVEEGPDPATQGRHATLKFFAALATAFDLETRDEAAQWAVALRDGRTPAAQRFALAAAVLNEVRFLVVLDNLEPALEVETLEIVDPDFAAGVAALATGVTRGSRVLVTCRYLPANLPTEQATVLHVPLGDFPRHDVLKFLRREPRVDERLNSGELSGEVFARLYAEFGGTPGFLEQVRKVLADPNLDLDALSKELKGVEPGLLAAERQAYYERIITSRLYDALSPDARRVASRLALSALPLPPDAVATIADLDEEGARRSLDSGVDYGLLQRFDAPDAPSLFQPPGLLSPWLSDATRLTSDAAGETHYRLAAFWQDAFKRDREDELRVQKGLELEACLHHARLGGDFQRWRWAALMLAGHLERISEWRRAYELIEQIPESERDGSCWHQLGTIDLNEGNYAAARKKLCRSKDIMQATGDKAGEALTWHELASIDALEGNDAAAREKFVNAMGMRQAIGDKGGEATTLHNLASIDLKEGNYAVARENLDKCLGMRQAVGDKRGEAATWHQLASIDVYERNYAAAREKFGKALDMLQAIGERAGEANTWRQLASIDLREGKYTAAREKFGKSLGMRQAIGDKAGEAVTFIQLGVVADELKRTAEAAPLTALCWLIDQSIGHGDVDSDFQALSALCQKLGYDQKAFDKLIERTTESYQKDRGRSLLKAAFPEWSD